MNGKEEMPMPVIHLHPEHRKQEERQEILRALYLAAVRKIQSRGA